MTRPSRTRRVDSMLPAPILTFLAVSCLSASSAASPTLWERAAHPQRGRADTALVRIERVFDGVNQADGDQRTMQDFRLGALAIAEMTGARELGDPRLFILLAEALIGAELGRDDEALKLLDRARSLAGKDDAWLEANILQLRATALRGKPSEAARAVTHALALVWERPARSYLLRERAEAKMALGDLRGSATDARTALGFASTSHTRALCRLALALALDRSGDEPNAHAEVRAAIMTAPSLIESAEGLGELAGRFGFRPQDARYVAALVRTVQARGDPDLESRGIEYEAALVEWERFLAEAPDEDRFLQLARSHRAACERALAELR